MDVISPSSGYRSRYSLLGGGSFFYVVWSTRGVEDLSIQRLRLHGNDAQWHKPSIPNFLYVRMPKT